MKLRLLTILFLVSIILVFPYSFSARAGDGSLGLVLVHGKQDRLPYKIDSLARHLKDKGYLVTTPEMPWSQKRIYDATYEEAMLEIDKAVEGLKKAGARKIVVGGLSLGASAALGYAARRDDLAGLIVMAPGPFPELTKFREMAASNVAQAKEMMSAGKGNKSYSFRDSNMGKTFTSWGTPKIYLSYFDPEGPAVVPVNAAKVRPSIPVLWIVGSQDPLTRPSSYAFDKIPANPKSKYLTVEAGHLEVPTVASEQIISWVEALGN